MTDPSPTDASPEEIAAALKAGRLSDLLAGRIH